MKIPIVEKQETFHEKWINKLKHVFGFNILTVMVLAFIVKLAFSFMVGSADLLHLFYFSELVGEGINPYTQTSFLFANYAKYPGFFFELLGMWAFLGGKTIFSIRILLLGFNLLSTYRFYQIGKELIDEETGIIYAIIFSLIPTNLIMFVWGTNESITLFFQLSTLLCFIRDEHIKSAIYLALGICFHLYPIMIMMVFFIYFFQNRDFLKILLYGIIMIVIFLVSSSIFLILDFQSYLQGLATNLSRSNDGLGFNDLIQFLYNGFTVIILSFEIDISYNLIFQLTTISLLFFYILRNSKGMGKMEIILCISMTYLITPIIFHQANLRNWAWATAFLIIPLFADKTFFSRIKPFLKKYAIIAMILLFIAQILTQTNFQYSLFQPIEDFDAFEKYILHDFYSPSHLMIIFLPITVVFFGVLGYLLENRSLSVMGILILTDFLILLFVQAFPAVQNWLYFYVGIRIMMVGKVILTELKAIIQ